MNKIFIALFVFGIAVATAQPSQKEVDTQMVQKFRTWENLVHKGEGKHEIWASFPYL